MAYKYINAFTRQTEFIAKADFNKILIKKFGAPYKEYREKWDLCGKFGLMPQFPLHLDVSLNMNCNARCQSCPQSLPYGHPIKETFGLTSAEMPFKVYKKIIDEGAKNGVCALNLSNVNEPLISPHFMAGLKYAVDSGIMDVMFYTNGTILDEKKAIEILDIEPAKVRFSINAAKNGTYNKLRNGFNLKTIIGNAERFMELKKQRGQKLPIAGVSFVVTRYNYKELPEFIEYWKNKADFICLQDYTNLFFGTKYAKEAEKLCPPKKFSARERGEKQFICDFPFKRLAIMPNGNVSPCCGFYGLRHKIGNIHKQSIKEIWMGKPMQHIRDVVNGNWEEKPNPCKLCFASFKRGEKSKCKEV